MARQKIFSVDGGSVQANDGLYIPRAADEELLELCRAGAFTYVLTPRQMGKSSLMVRTAERLSDEGFTPIIIDLQAIGVELTAEQWYYGLVSEIDEKTSLRTNVKRWWKEHEELGFGQRLTLFFKDVLLAESGPEEHIVIFVDEIDTTLSLKFSDDFFTAVRSIYGSRASDPRLRRLSFVLIGVATPTDLISDPKRTPFNIGQRVDLTDFTFDEALPLAAGLKLSEAESRDVLRWALGWTGGHPFLTQQLCAAIAAKGKASWTGAEVDAVVAEKFLGEDFGKNSNLLFVRDMLTKRAPDRESVLNTYADVLRGERPIADEGQSVPKAHLKLSGVVCAEDGVLRVRNRIYREVFNERWVKKHNPPNWTKRLTRAAAALVAAVLFLMLPVGVFALYQWRRADSERKVADVARQDAERQRDRAEAALKEAEAERQKALAAAAQEEQARHAAEKAKAAAEQSADKEKKAKTEAEQQRAEAVRQREEAVAARRDAEEQRQRAEAAAADALRQRAAAEEASREAVGQRDLAEKNAKLAAQSQLVAQSLATQKAGNIQHSVLLAREAMRDKFDTFSIDAYYALSEGLALLPRPVRSYAGLFSDVALSADDKYLLSGLRPDAIPFATLATTPRSPNTISVHDFRGGESSAQSFGYLSAVAFSPDKKYLLTSEAPFSNTSPSVLANANLSVPNANFGVGNSNAGGSGATNSNGPLNFNGRPANANRAGGAGRAFTAKVWQWSDGRLTEVARDIRLGTRVEAVALGPDGKQFAVAGSRPVALARARGAAAYRPAGLFFGGAPQTQAAGPLVLVADVENQTAAQELSLPRRLSASPVKAMTFSASGRLLALAQEDGTWVVWARSDEKGYRLVAHGKQPGEVNALALSPDLTPERDGPFLVTAGKDGVAYVWALGSQLKRGGASDFKSSSFAAVAFGGLYADLEDDEGETTPSRSISGHGGAINAVAFSPDGRYLATAGDDKTARVWVDWRESDVSEAARMSHEGPVESVGFGGGGALVATASADGTARVWEAPGSGRGVSEVLFGDFDSGALSPNQRFVMLYNEKETRIWDMATGEVLYQTENDPDTRRPRAWGASSGSAAVSDDGRYLIVNSADEKGQGMRARAFDVKEGRWLWEKPWRVDTDGARFSADGKYVAFAGATSALPSTVSRQVVLDLRSGDERLQLSEAEGKERIHFGDFTADSKHVLFFASEGGDKDEGTIRVREVQGGGRAAEWSIGRIDYLTTVAVGGRGGKDGGGYVAAADNQSLRVWEALSGTLVNQIKFPFSGYASVKFSPDGKHLALIMSGRGVQIWQIAGDNTRPVATISSNNNNFSDTKENFYFSADGAYISTPSANGTVSIWNVLTGCEVARFGGAGGFVSKDGSRVLLISNHGMTARKLRVKDLFEEVCPRLTRGITASEWNNEYMIMGSPLPQCPNLKPETETAPKPQQTGESCRLNQLP